VLDIAKHVRKDLGATWCLGESGTAGKFRYIPMLRKLERGREKKQRMGEKAPAMIKRDMEREEMWMTTMKKQKRTKLRLSSKF